MLWVFLLDTDHLIVLQRQSEPEYGRLRAAMNRYGPNEFSLSLTSFHEQMLGANAYISRANNRSQIVRGYQMLELCLIDFNKFRVLPFDEPAATRFEDLRKQVRVGTMDLRIAATALSSDLTLLTRNTVDFQKIPGLKIEDWTTTG